MKAVILLAGKGRRMNSVGIKHKSLTMLDDKSMLYHLINNIEKAGFRDIIPIVGYNGREVLAEIEKVQNVDLKTVPIWNMEYETTNNLYSLYQAREMLEGEEFITINGDMIFDYRILLEILVGESSQIAIDDKAYKEPIDSPGVIIKNDRIIDLGRHIPFDKKNGYAVGIYRYSQELSKPFFTEAENMLIKNRNAGFHDPLIKLFSRYFIKSCSVKQYLWTDIDEEKDISKARKILEELKRKHSST